MITQQMLDEILGLKTLADWIAYVGCGKGSELQCYVCDPNMQRAVQHMNMYLNVREREAIGKAICGCGAAPPAAPQTPSAPAVTPPSTPATPAPTVPVVHEETCPETMPAKGSYSTEV